jgi:hypothetical protein
MNNTGGEHPFKDLYPGDRYVDWVGLDGFNWALRGEWNSFTDIFDNSYEELAELTDRPMIIAETGSSESGGDKAEWLTSALSSEIPRMPRIRAIVFFDDRFEDLDSRVDSSPEALRAFRSAVAAPEYRLGRAAFLATPAEFGHGPAAAPEPPGDGYGSPSWFYSLTHKLHGRYLWIAVGAGIILLVLLTVAVLAARKSPRSRRRLGGPAA